MNPTWFFVFVLFLMHRWSVSYKDILEELVGGRAHSGRPRRSRKVSLRPVTEGRAVVWAVWAGSFLPCPAEGSGQKEGGRQLKTAYIQLGRNISIQISINLEPRNGTSIEQNTVTIGNFLNMLTRNHLVIWSEQSWRQRSIFTTCIKKEERRTSEPICLYSTCLK